MYQNDHQCNDNVDLVFGKVLYSRMDGCLQSTFNQFEFKRKHMTENCVLFQKNL